MSAKSLYEEDFHAWALQQARVLRDLAGRVPLPNELDLEHVAEEVEDLGNEQRFQVESNLTQAMIHLLKVAAQPDDDAVRHWLKEVLAFRANARKRYRRSMRQLIEPGALWADAIERVRGELDLDERSGPDFPVACPYTLDDLLGPDPDPRTLAARLREALPTSP
jgi:hypothetical protein